MRYSSVVLHASKGERDTHEITPSGYGIHWPLVDEDLTIDGLFGISHSPDEHVAILNTRDERLTP